MLCSSSYIQIPPKVEIDALIREVVAIPVSENVCSFLGELEYEEKFSFWSQGVLSQITLNQRTYYVAVSKIQKTATEPIDAMTDKSFFVECYTEIGGEDRIAVARDLKLFSAYFSNHLDLGKKYPHKHIKKQWFFFKKLGFQCL